MHFKARLDIWLHQAVKFDLMANLSGTVHRSGEQSDNVSQ